MLSALVGFIGIYLCVLAPVRVSGQEFSFKKGKIMFTVPNASDLLNGEILGSSLDEVLDESVAEALNKVGLVLGEDTVSFETKLDNQGVGRKKCVYEAELREPVVSGEIGTENQVRFKADKNFMVTANLVLPLDVALTGILHTKIFAHAIFKCIHLKDVEFPFTTKVSADIKVKIMVFLNPEVMRKGDKVLLMLDPQVKLMEMVEEFNSSTNVQVEIFKGVRINFVEGWIEKLVNKAIESRGELVISETVGKLEQELQV